MLGEDRVRVHLRNHKRAAGIHAERRRVVDDDRADAHQTRRQHGARIVAAREDHEVVCISRQPLERRTEDGDVAIAETDGRVAVA